MAHTADGRLPGAAPKEGGHPEHGECIEQAVEGACDRLLILAIKPTACWRFLWADLPA